MLDREPFLKAIFAAPDDDLPRLVFADFLDEHGDHDWAELIRVQCELMEGWSADLAARETELLARLPVRPHPEARPDRGLIRSAVIAVAADLLADPDAFRTHACDRHPEWYGAPRLLIAAGRITTPEQLATILSSPVTEHVTVLDLSGREEVVEDPAKDFLPAEFVLHPAITTTMVQTLATMRECRRLAELDLRNNDLDNDAARALAQSPHLFRLKALYLSEGNALRGRVWQQVLERFGPDVVQ